MGTEGSAADIGRSVRNRGKLAHIAGRPRNTAASSAILAAALAVLGDRGYDGLRLEEVARVAGVGKSTLYLRFPTRPRLAAAAVASLQRELPAPTGELRHDLVSSLRAAERNLGGLGWGVIASLLGEGGDDAGQWRARLMDPVVTHLRRLLARDGPTGRGARPEPGSRAGDAEVAVDLLIGALLNRALLGSAAATPWPERIVDAVLASLSGPADDQGSPKGWSSIP